MQRILSRLLWPVILFVAVMPAYGADHMIAAANRLSTGSPLFIAKEKGFFAANGLDVDLSFQNSAQDVGLAVASGSADVGMTGFTAAIYTLAARGRMKIIAGGTEEAPGRGSAIVFRKEMIARGETKFQDLVGKRVGITTFGSPQHNAILRIAAKYHLPVDKITLVPFQTLSNQMAAFRGGQVDATLTTGTLAIPLEKEGVGKIIGWVGDESPSQLGGLFASTSAIARQPDAIARFLKAYVAACRYFDAAFQSKDPQGERAKGANFDEAVKIISKYTGESPASLVAGLPYINPTGRPLTSDIDEQIQVWKRVGAMSPDAKPANVFELKFIDQMR